jgi:hypothetical protein
VSEFVATLRRGVADAQHAAVIAQEAGHPHEAYLHRVRLRELLEIASRNGIDARGWVDPTVRRDLDDDLSLAGA